MRDMIKETNLFSQVEKFTGISMSTLKREARKRKAEILTGGACQC